MRFDKYIPCDLLRPFVKEFVISESDKERIYKVLPDTGLVIGFQYRGKLSQFDQEKEILLSRSGITGLQDRFRLFKNAADTGTLLVFFKEAGAAVFFKEPVHELFRESVSLDNFMLRSELLILEERLVESKSDSEKINAVEQFLISRMEHAAPDHLILSALAIIHKSKGNIRINHLIRELHTSQSPLEKRFRRVVGTSPKKFASIVRLKHAIQQHDPRNSLTDLGYEAGYYDQAHFIKEFRNFTGENPDAFLNGS